MFISGIHPGLHAEGVYEFWEPTLELLLDKEVVTVFSVLNKEEYQQTLDRLDYLFCKYLYKGLNPFASHHVKQTPHDADLMWASNMYLIVFKVLYFYVSIIVMESSLARLGSGSSRIFLLLLEKLEPKKSAGLIWLN
jgi:hypothetical protein